MWKPLKRRGNQWRNKAEQTVIKENSLDSSKSEVLLYERKTQSLLCEHFNEWQRKWRKKEERNSRCVWAQKGNCCRDFRFSQRRCCVIRCSEMWSSVLGWVGYGAFRTKVMSSSSGCQQSVSSKLRNAFTQLRNFASQKNCFLQNHFPGDSFPEKGHNSCESTVILDTKPEFPRLAGQFQQHQLHAPYVILLLCLIRCNLKITCLTTYCHAGPCSRAV